MSNVHFKNFIYIRNLTPRPQSPNNNKKNKTDSAQKPIIAQLKLHQKVNGNECKEDKRKCPT